ncbi:MAG: DUF1738 domain-containing protein [Clostridia bacterium]|nr:DUF1738 domain-containing protein [Clostridia bacterium]
MNENDKANNLDKLTPTKKYIAEQMLENLKNNDSLWVQGWESRGAPESIITGKKYRGINNLSLTVTAMARGYSDNRWVSYKQMEANDWHFKTNEEGNSLGKGAGVTVEYFELRDRETKKPFNKTVLDGMTREERNEYMDKNVYPLRKYYRLFNCDIVDGVPELEKSEVDQSGISDKAEDFIAYWNENEARIKYGGDMAYYSPKDDIIQLPKRDMFSDMNEFYATALHEIGHSTGHETRLNRDLSGKFGTDEYATEELRAEIASMFLEQELNVKVSEKHFENNSKYVKAWYEKISEDPNVLFTAIADADKISGYVIEKQAEDEKRKNTEYYSIVQVENEEGETEYKVYGVMPYGQVRALIDYEFKSLDELKTEIDNLKVAPAYEGKTFEEVPYDKLDEISRMEYEREEKKAEKEERAIYAPPSLIAAMSVAAVRKPVNMSERGIESLVMPEDREVVERASKTKNAEKFSQLYHGLSVLGSEEKDERSLMTRLAMFVGGDKERLLRVFKSSGQYREGKPNAFYEEMASKSLKFVSDIMSDKQPIVSDMGKGRFGANAKV